MVTFLAIVLVFLVLRQCFFFASNVYCWSKARKSFSGEWMGGRSVPQVWSDCSKSFSGKLTEGIISAVGALIFGLTVPELLWIMVASTIVSFSDAYFLWLREKQCSAHITTLCSR